MALIAAFVDFSTYFISTCALVEQVVRICFGHEGTCLGFLLATTVDCDGSLLLLPLVLELLDRELRVFEAAIIITSATLGLLRLEFERSRGLPLGRCARRDRILL